MKKRLAGIVSEDEKNEIERLFERKNGLSELMISLSNNPLLDEELKNATYEKIVHDMGKTKTAFDKWWQDMQKKYSWESLDGYSYQIKFDSNEIMLVKDEVMKKCC